MKLPIWLKSFGRKSGSTETLNFVQYLQQLKGEKTQYYTDWVYAGFHTIAQSLARVEWELLQVDKAGKVKEVLDSHPLLGLLYKFNNKTTRFEATAKTVLGFLLDGEVGWYLGDKKGNKPTAIYVVPKSAYSVKAKDQFGYPVTYQVSVTGGGKIDVSSSDFLVIKNTNPNSNERGFSVLEALRDVADTDYYISRWNKNLMKNDAQPSGIIELPPDKTLDPESLKLLKQEVTAALAGYDNAHKLAVLHGGAKLTTTTLNPKELDFNNGRAFNRDLLLAVIGTPKTLLGLDNGVTKATAETAERVFAKYTLEPILEQIVEWLNEYLVPAFGDNLWLSFEPLAAEDMEQKINGADRGYNRWLTTNETRAMFGYEPVAGGDFIYMPLTNLPMVGGATKPAKELEGINYIKIKGNEVEGKISLAKARYIKNRVNSRKAYASLVAGDVAQKVEEKLNKKMEQKSKGVKVVLKLRPEHKHFTDEEKTVLWNGYITRKRAQDGNLKTVFEKIFEHQKTIVLRKLNESGKGAEFKIKPTDILFDKEAEIRATIALIEPQYYAMVTEGLGMAASLAGAEPLAITDIPAMAEWIKKIADKYGTDITETTYDQLAGVIQRGLDAGQGVYELGNGIEDYFGNVAPSRADTIARTESARAMTASEGFAWEEYGIKEAEWYLAGSDPCPICVGNSQKSWSIEKTQKGTVEYAHPNCECLFLPK